MEEKKVEKSENSKRGSRARAKGHRCEVLLAKEFRELGYPDCATTRATSRLLDSCAIDLNFIKFNIQSKADKRNFNFKNYLELIDEVNSRILKLPTELQYRLTYPTIVFHTKDRECLCILRKQDLYELIKQIPK
jgi:hypothetical protein